MSLKAKIEAVIYASEEPVTLAQLTGLLGQEAQAELDHLESAQQTLELHAESAQPEDGSNSDDISAEDVTALAEAPDEDADDTPAPPELVSEEPLAGQAGESAAPAPTASSPDPAPPEPAPLTGLAAIEKDEKQVAKEEKDRARRLREYFREILDELIADYASSGRGLEIREVASGFRLATKPEYHDAVRGFVKSLKPPLKLTLQALETLAVVAYKQPVTAPEISEIRGVDSSGVLGSLIARKLITTAGRKQVIGRPILYKTTRDFLLRFGLKDVSELPSIEEFEKLAGELADSEAVQEEIPMTQPESAAAGAETAEELEPSKGLHEPQADGDDSPLDQASTSTPTPDGTPADPPEVRLAGAPPASTVPGADNDPTEAEELARQIERDQP